MVKKVLFLSPLPPPHYGSAMSSEMCLNILKEAKDIEVRNIKLNYSKEMGDVGKINLDKITGIFKVKEEIKKQILDFKPDIIYFVPATTSLGLFRDAYFVKEIKKHFRKKILFHIRSRILNNDWDNKTKRKILTNMFKNQKAIVLGKELIGDLHNLIPKKDIFILPNAIKNEVLDNELKQIIKKRKQNKHLEILFLSNMDKTKGWPKLLEACKILNEKQIDFKCNFVGAWQNKKDENYFNNFVSKNNLQKKVFAVGKKVGNDKRKYLEEAHVLVFPTEYKLETFGRVILEGMMYGLPVISNGIATIPTTIKQGKTGFVLKENKPEEIVECLEKLFDGDLRNGLGEAARKRFLEGYGLSNYVGNFIWILKIY